MKKYNISMRSPFDDLIFKREIVDLKMPWGSVIKMIGVSFKHKELPIEFVIENSYPLTSFENTSAIEETCDHLTKQLCTTVFNAFKYGKAGRLSDGMKTFYAGEWSKEEGQWFVINDQGRKCYFDIELNLSQENELICKHPS